MGDFSGPWPAPAKLNLMLRVTGRRADGYHELQTVFQFIERMDRLHFRLRADGRIVRVDGPDSVPVDADLTVRAARLLQSHTGCRQGADIRLEKTLPLGGGLGGGSSDAATVLVALNRLWGMGLNEDELARIGLELGADVPVFVRGQAAWGEGVGEYLVPMRLQESWYLVLIPPCHVSTASVFGAPDLTRNSPRITIPDFLAGDTANDCLPVVLKVYPPVARALAWLDLHADGRLTGTGACCFAVFSTETAAQNLLEQVPDEFTAFVARGMNRSPLLDYIED